MPKTNVEFWERKLERNRTRDRAAADDLGLAGWKVLVVWECALREEGWETRLTQRINQPAAPAS